MTLTCIKGCCSFISWNYDAQYKPFIPKQANKAGGILMHNGKVLIVQSRGNKWGFPKGSLENNETIAECAQREVREETSLNLRLSNDDIQITYKEPHQTKLTFFLTRLNESPTIDIDSLKKPGNDCTGIGWIKITCLKMQIRKEISWKTKLRKINTEKTLEGAFNSLSLNTLAGASSSKPPTQPQMLFNASIKKFTKAYLHSK
jgi:8-oxo-dGTP pyrophosphatase MutT (NUDIX family)